MVCVVKYRVARGPGVTQELATIAGTREEAEAFAQERRNALPEESRYVNILEYVKE
jgi:hypothetical protein